MAAEGEDTGPVIGLRTLAGSRFSAKLCGPSNKAEKQRLAATFPDGGGDIHGKQGPAKREVGIKALGERKSEGALPKGQDRRAWGGPALSARVAPGPEGPEERFAIITREPNEMKDMRRWFLYPDNWMFSGAPASVLEVQKVSRRLNKVGSEGPYVLQPSGVL